MEKRCVLEKYGELIEQMFFIVNPKDMNSFNINLTILIILYHIVNIEQINV
jgi:hypothetical protein